MGGSTVALYGVLSTCRAVPRLQRFNKLKSKEVESITLFNKKVRTLSKKASANNVDSSPVSIDTTPPDNENDSDSVISSLEIKNGTSGILDVF